MRTKYILLLLIPVYFSKLAFADEKFAKSFVGVFNEGSRTEVIKYLQKNMSNSQIERYGIDAHVGVLLNQQNTFGQLEVQKHLSAENGNERVRVISSNNDLEYNLMINRERKAPFKINYFTFEDVTSDAQKLTTITAQELKQELTNFIDKLARNEAFSGVVLVAEGKDVLFQEAVGYANRPWRMKNEVETKFSLGSMNKMFTALAALQLIEQGKLKFEDKLIDFVDTSWLPQGEVEAITVRHLLTHTSGFGNFFNDEFNKSNKEAYRDLTAYKPLVSSSPLLFSPGTQNRYSNSGMLMLGLVIESVTGTSYYDYVQENIYNKAGMINTGSFELDSSNQNLATGYLKRSYSDDWVNSIYTRAIKGSPAGGGFSTVGDLHKFAIALTEYKLLSKELTEEAYSEKTDYNSAFWYGYGFSVSGEPDNRIVGHGGAYLGVDARLDIYLDKGFTVVILGNQSDTVAPVRKKINELITRYR